MSRFSKNKKRRPGAGFKIILVAVILLALAFVLPFDSLFAKSLLSQHGFDSENKNSQFSDTRGLGEFLELTRHLKEEPSLSDISGEFTKNISLERRLLGDRHYKIAYNFGADTGFLEDLDNKKVYSISLESFEPFYKAIWQREQAFLKQQKLHSVKIVGLDAETTAFELSYRALDGTWQPYKNEIDKEKSRGEQALYTYEGGEPDIDITLAGISGLKSTCLISESGKTIKEVDLESGIEFPDKNGSYDCGVKSSFENDILKLVQTTDFKVDVSLPYSFEVSKSEIEQGDFVEIRVKNAKAGAPPKITSDYDDKLAFTKSADGDYLAVIPSSYDTKPNDYNIEYGYDGDMKTLGISIKPRDFSVQQLEISETIVAETRNEESYAEFEKYYPSSLTKDLYTPSSSSVKDMDFVLPTGGLLTTEYGETRYVNGAPTYYYHSGLDIAWDLGDDILSTADGVVALSKKLILTGNTVVISHGHGLFSTYYHMDSISVDEGEKVLGGQVIGTQGTSGFSTGVHLHFMISHYGTNMDPGYFIYGKKVTYGNYEELFADKSPTALRNANN